MINPKRIVPDDAIKIHGYSQEYLSDKDTFDKVADDFINFVKNKKIIIHNAPFDIGFLNGELNFVKKELIKKMDELGIILDVTHLSDQCFFEALDIYTGTVWASHSNCRALVENPRQFSDEQIKLLIERGAVLGSVYDAWMMIPDWVRGTSTPESTGVKLEHIVNHIDHICQLAGNTHHVGIGSDLDGGFGREQSPLDLNTIADLQNLEGILSKRGYNEEDIAGIFSGNFLRLLREAWT